MDESRERQDRSRRDERRGEVEAEEKQGCVGGRLRGAPVDVRIVMDGSSQLRPTVRQHLQSGWRSAYCNLDMATGATRGQENTLRATFCVGATSLTAVANGACTAMSMSPPGVAPRSPSCLSVCFLSAGAKRGFEPIPSTGVCALCFAPPPRFGPIRGTRNSRVQPRHALRQRTPAQIIENV